MSEGRFRETMGTIGGCMMGLAFMVIPILLLIAVFKSMGWIATVILPISAWVSLVAFVLVPVWLLLAIPRVTRAWSGLGLVLSSYGIGLSLWVWSLVIAYVMAGAFWMIVGLCFAGVGVVAVAAIASLLQGEWLVLLQIVIGVVVVYVLRLVGNVFIEKSEPKEEYRPMPPDPPDFYEA